MSGASVQRPPGYFCPMARVFVTGASGKIGRRLLPRLVASGHEVTGLTRREHGRGIIEEAGGRALVGDLHDTKRLIEQVGDAAIVYHLAGGVRGPGHQTPERINVEATRSLIEALHHSKVTRVVFTSTSAVYGDRSGLWVDEGMRPWPNTRFGESKAACEEALLASGLPTRIARLGVVYGPAFPVLLADALARGRAFLPGEGRNYMPMVHVDDVVAALTLIEEQGGEGEAYNVADTEPRLFGDFYRLVHGQVGGRPVRFWSTWIPSYIQQRVARKNERFCTRINRTPRFTPDNLRLYTASLRMKVDRLRDELGMTWQHPNIESGVAASFAHN